MNEDWNTLINRDNLFEYLSRQLTDNIFISETEAKMMMQFIQAPVGQQEVWAVGVTYLRSRDARIDESKVVGGADFENPK